MLDDGNSVNNPGRLVCMSDINLFGSSGVALLRLHQESGKIYDETYRAQLRPIRSVSEPCRLYPSAGHGGAVSLWMMVRSYRIDKMSLLLYFALLHKITHNSNHESKAQNSRGSWMRNCI